MSEVDIPDIHLKVLYDFEYTTKGGRKVTIREGEKLFLIKKTNSDWWQVIRSSTERPFYVPATYVEEYSWNQTGNSKDISRCSSFKKNTEKKLNTFAPLSEYRTLPSSVSSEKDDILLDKRKSWAVEELVAELSKMRSENAKDKISVEKDKDSENTDELSKKDNINQVGLTDSLEKLAQQIQFDPTVTSSIRSTEKLTQHHFDPVVTSSSRSTPTKLSTSLEEPSPALEETSGKMDSVFSRVKSKLGYSSSFKTKKELQQVLKKGVGNSVLSTSWEMALSETDGNQKSSHLTLPDEGLMRTSGSGLESVKGEAKVLDTQLKPCRSGGDLDFIDKRSDSKKSPNQSWNLLRNKVRSGKLKQIVCVSESESEEYLDESLGQDEDSVSGLSDDNLLFQSSSSRVYSDISDGAISDDLVIETAGEGRKNQAGSQKRKVSLTRGSRVETHAARHYSSPPSPSPGHQPVRVLTEGWEEYRTPTGRTYYFNQLSRDKSWKPPRRQIKHNESAEDGSVENLRSDSSSPLAEANGSSGTCFVPVPKGWRQEFDDETGQPCYLNETSGAKWFSSNDSEGRIYFFEENSNESSWTLPEVTITSTTCDSPLSTKPVPRGSPVGGKKAAKEEKLQPDGEVQLRSEQTNVEPEIKMQFRMAKAHSMAVLESGGKQASSKSSSIPRNWPQLWDGNMCVLKEGTLNRTKITENGKKVRKNWAPAHVVLTELFLLFFKDAKSFAAMKNTQGESHSTAARPEFSVDLNGAQLEHGEKASSRRNVFLVSALLGLQVLVQCDSAPQAEEWYQAIQKAIADLPSACDSCPRNKTPKLSPQFLGRGSQSPDEFKKSSRIGRSRSVKLKMTAREGSQEDLTISPEENQTKIRNRLKKFFHRRPTREALVKKGIYKDEPVFGCHLPDVCKGENPRVPAFVQRCVAAIECKEENMKTDGLYRASGNLSQVQKIRLQVDQNNLTILEHEEDVHVLTGTLKLFFRELKKPLIPFEHFNKALKASTNPNKKEKLQHFREIVKALPQANRDTLEFLLRHLLRVTGYQEFNRMHIPNLAIVFGPTLMWPEAESLNMALDLMQQNLVIECFLQEFDNIFR